MANRKSKTPRASSTYRAARRNAVLRGDVKGVWRGAEATYRPYIIKPPILKFVQAIGGEWNLVGLKERQQPTQYPYSSKRQNERNLRKIKRAEAA